MKRLRFVSLLLILAIVVVSLVKPAQAASTVTVNAATTFQVIDGFGASAHFGIASLIKNLPNASQVMSMLFDPNTGAGFTIVRNGIGPTSILTTNPGSPTTPPNYTWDGSDSQQVWFSQTAKSLGATTFYADAWTAPAFMKTNNQIANGGFLCGETGSGAPTCASGDWRQAYANYLVQYVKDYASVNIPLSYVGYINEPDFTASYDSMNFDATQVGAGSRGTLDTTMRQDIDFIKNYLGPALKAAGLSTKVSCCEATSWDNTAIYTRGILADATASANLGLVTGHAYYGSPNGQITTPITTSGQHVWETETSSFDGWNAAWDDNTEHSGFQWAQDIWNALVNAKVNGFLYWWFAENNSSNSDNEGLLNINGTTVSVSKRLWSFANYSRFIRPGANLISATSANANLKITAAKNVDGSLAIVVLNAGTADESTTFTLSGATVGSSAVPYLTNSTNDTAQQTAIAISGGSFTGTIPARSLVTYKIAAGTGGTIVPPTATNTLCACPITPSPTRTNTSVIPTNTPFVGPTPTPTSPTASGGLQTSIRANGAETNQQTPFAFTVKNTSTSAKSGISVRIYYKLDGSNTASNYMLEKYYDQSGVATVSAPAVVDTLTAYITVNYGTASLAAGAQWEFQTALHLSSWGTTYDGTNDHYHTGYAFNALPAAYTVTNYIPAYVNGTLAWGVQPGTIVPSNTPVSTADDVPPTATKTNTPPITPSATSVTATPTKSNTPVTPIPDPTITPIIPTATNTNTPVPPPSVTPNASDPCASPTVITGGGTFAITTTAKCFKYVNTTFTRGGMFSVMKDGTATSDTLKWYGGLDQNVTACANQTSTISGNGGQLNNFTVAKDANGQMFLTITGAAANNVTISITNWQNGNGCSVVPTVHP